MMGATGARLSVPTPPVSFAILGAATVRDTCRQETECDKNVLPMESITSVPEWALQKAFQKNGNNIAFSESRKEQ